MKRTCMLPLILAATCFAPAAASAKDTRPGRPEVLPSEIRGTVRINGWTGDPSRIKVHALPGSVAVPDDTRPAHDPRVPERTARLTAIEGDPVEFRFTIKGLKAFSPYQISIELPAGPRGPEGQAERTGPKVFWRGLLGGIALSGAPPVAIEGFIARTEVEIRDGEGNWVGADDLQFDNRETALRTLRWKTSVPGTLAGELQISTSAFPTSGRFGPCDEPDGGLVYRRQFPVGDAEWQEIGSLDFTEILRPSRTPPPTDDRPPNADSRTEPLDGTGLNGSTSDVVPVSQNDLRLLSIGAPLYARIVPVTMRGPACDIREDGVHGWVILSKLPKIDPEDPPPPPVQPHIEPAISTYAPPHLPGWTDGLRHPNMGGDSAYVVVKDHKLPPCKSWQYGKGFCPKTYASWTYIELLKKWLLTESLDPLGQILVDTGIFPPNKVLKYPDVFAFVWVYSSSSCTGFCLVGQVVTGLATGAFNGIGNFVMMLSDTFKSIKEGVADVLADVVKSLPGIGAACDVVSCRAAIELGMNYGLASMGLPPDLPNWNDVKSQGLDYLAATVASEMAQTTGLPEEVTNLGADEAMKLALDTTEKTLNEMTKKQGSQNGAGYDWVLPYSGVDPALWTIWVKKKPDIKLMSNLYIRTRASSEFVLPSPFSGNVYRPADIRVPTEFPSSNTIEIPIVMQPDYSTIPPPKCYKVPGYKVMCVSNPNSFFNLAQCLTTDGYGPWESQDCRFWENYIGVYYRDYWLDKRLHFSGCLSLTASAFTQKDIDFADIDSWFKDPWLPYYPPFVDLAFLVGDKPAFWLGPFYANCK